MVAIPREKDYAGALRRLERMLAAGREGSDAVLETLVTEMAGVVGGSSACWHRSDPASGLPVSASAFGDPPGSFEESLRYEFHGNDFSRFRDLRVARQPVAATSIETRGEPSSSARFREMIEPTGSADELRIALMDPFGIWAAIVIFTDRRLTPADVSFVTDAVPMATSALRGAVASEALATAADDAVAVERDPTDSGAPAVLILDCADRIVAADAIARARLALLPETRDVQLPGVIAFLAAQARHGDPIRPATARMRTDDGRWFILDASRLDETPEANVAVVIQPAPSAAVLDAVLRALGLSAREREVAALVVQGHSTDAIASTLTLSPWTVQDHLKAIYEKTGVRKRSDLAILATNRLVAAGA